MDLTYFSQGPRKLCLNPPPMSAFLLSNNLSLPNIRDDSNYIFARETFWCFISRKKALCVCCNAIQCLVYSSLVYYQIMNELMRRWIHNIRYSRINPPYLVGIIWCSRCESQLEHFRGALYSIQQYWQCVPRWRSHKSCPSF